MDVGYVLINTLPEKEKQTYKEVLNLSEVEYIEPIFGEYDFIAKINTSHFENIGKIVTNNIRTIDSVIKTKTLTIDNSLLEKTLKEETIG